MEIFLEDALHVWNSLYSIYTREFIDIIRMYLWFFFNFMWMTVAMDTFKKTQYENGNATMLLQFL